MAEVWLAQDRRLGDKHVAVKRLLGFDQGRVQATDIERSRREALAASRLNHPNLVAVTDFVADDGEPFIVMEYVDGSTLDDQIAGRGLPAERAAKLIGQVAAALAEAHELGIVHRDIKPANIMITKRDNAKLADFGIARSAGDSRLTHAGFFTGTAAYLAPELLDGSDATSASDVWALGAVLFEAVEGRLAFNGETTAAVIAAVAFNEIPRSTRSPELAPIIDRMLRREPSERLSIQDATDQLAAVGTGTATRPLEPGIQERETIRLDGPLPPRPPATPTPPPPGAHPPGQPPPGSGGGGRDRPGESSAPLPFVHPSAGRSGRGRWVVAAALVLVLVAAAIVVALTRGGDDPAPDAGPSGSGGAAGPPASSGSPAARTPPLRVLAHRGGRESFAEQSVPAFVAAAKAGYGVETDVRWTSDDVPVLVHDPTTTSNLDCDGRTYTVAEITLETLKAKCHTPAAASPDGKEYPVPTLEDAAKALADVPGARLFAEVKVTQTDDQAAEFLAILRRYDLIDQAVVTSFKPAELVRMRQTAKPIGVTLQLMLLLNRGDTASVTDLRKAGATWVAVELEAATKSYLAELRQAGIKTVGYLANTEDEWRRLQANGVDYVLTDVPRAYLTWLGNR